VNAANETRGIIQPRNKDPLAESPPNNWVDDGFDVEGSAEQWGGCVVDEQRNDRRDDLLLEGMHAEKQAETQ